MARRIPGWKGHREKYREHLRYWISIWSDYFTWSKWIRWWWKQSFRGCSVSRLNSGIIPAVIFTCVQDQIKNNPLTGWRYQSINGLRTFIIHEVGRKPFNKALNRTWRVSFDTYFTFSTQTSARSAWHNSIPELLRWDWGLLVAFHVFVNEIYRRFFIRVRRPVITVDTRASAYCTNGLTSRELKPD